MTNRQAAAQETRQKLLAAGKKLIAERGLSEIAVEDITAASGVSKGTFYTYFKSKEEIACALSAEMFGSARAEAEQMSGSCAEKVALYMSRFSEWIERSGRGLARDWIRGVVDHARADDSKYRSDRADMDALLADCVQKGLLRADAALGALSGALIDLLYGQLLAWCMGGECGLRARTEAFCRALLPDILKNNLP